MGKRTSIRLYKSGDAKGINEMFTKHTPYLRDDAYWTWINRIVGQSISVVAECDDRIIGHYIQYRHQLHAILFLGGKQTVPYPAGQPQHMAG